MARNDPQLNIRVSESLKQRLARIARQNGRSLTAEIAHHLERLVPPGEPKPARAVTGIVMPPAQLGLDLGEPVPPPAHTPRSTPSTLAKLKHLPPGFALVLRIDDLPMRPEQSQQREPRCAPTGTASGAPRAALASRGETTLAALLRARTEITAREVCALLGGRHDDRATQMRIAAQLKSMGWHSERRLIDGERIRVYKACAPGAIA